ncbi:AbiH family protein [Chryseobacterium sp. sg2396]
MNKLIIVGNGFDLAHGLDTKYSDMIDFFWNLS